MRYKNSGKIMLIDMAHPAIIRTDFPSAEDAAELYGIPQSRVTKILKVLSDKKKVTAQGIQIDIRIKSAARGKKRRARKK